jgi:acetylornithine/N-succinyldiaminopimelate aminotransferase
MSINKEDFRNYQAQTTNHPMMIDVAKAEGVFIYDLTGKKYFDMIAGLAVANIGHKHPRLINAIKNQLDQYLHVMPYGEYVQSPQTKLAKKLCEILPANLNTSYFVNSGTEANEAALKLAKRYTGRTKIVSCKKSYHGSTHGSLSVSGNELKKYAFRPLLPEVYFMEFNNLNDLDLIDNQTACVIIETVQGDAGVRIPDKKYMQALRKKCTEIGALLILDEIQVGFGRTGKFFAFEHFDIVPDILTIAKSMAGGMPIGAFVSSKEIMKTLSFDPMLGHITTFGGHPVCCAAALENINILLDEKMIDSVEEKGKLIQELIAHSSIQEIRRIGLMFAIEFDTAQTVEKVFTKCLQRGVITFWFLSCKNSFRLAPPLTISIEEIKEACSIIKLSIEEVAKGV